jgi:hypothetical protein
MLDAVILTFLETELRSLGAFDQYEVLIEGALTFARPKLEEQLIGHVHAGDVATALAKIIPEFKAWIENQLSLGKLVR